MQSQPEIIKIPNKNKYADRYTKTQDKDVTEYIRKDIFNAVKNALLKNWVMPSFDTNYQRVYCSQCGVEVNGEATKHGNGCLIDVLMKM